LERNKELETTVRQNQTIIDDQAQEIEVSARNSEIACEFLELNSLRELEALLRGNEIALCTHRQSNKFFFHGFKMNGGRGDKFRYFLS